MAGIIGAFFAGMIFADYSPEWSLKTNVEAITEFLGPFFFFSIGAQFDPRLFTPGILSAALILSVLAIVTKFVGCGLPVLGEGWHAAFEVGIGMVPRGEVALIVAMVGLNSNIVSQSNYAIVVFMTAGIGHNDAVMTACMVLSLYFLLRRWYAVMMNKLGTIDTCTK